MLAEVPRSRAGIAKIGLPIRLLPLVAAQTISTAVRRESVFTASYPISGIKAGTNVCNVDSAGVVSFPATPVFFVSGGPHESAISFTMSPKTLCGVARVNIRSTKFTGCNSVFTLIRPLPLRQRPTLMLLIARVKFERSRAAASPSVGRRSVG